MKLNRRKTHIKVFSIAIALLSFTKVVIGQVPDSLGNYLSVSFDHEGHSLNYRIMYPLDFDESKTYPLVVFLHGAGERGDNNKSQLVHGSRLFRDSLEKYPAVVIFPQCPRESYWGSVDREYHDDGRRTFSFNPDNEITWPLASVMAMVGEFSGKSFIDRDRLYLAGLSMGGMGTWELLWRMPHTFACAMPICGGGATSKAPSIVDVPIWAFHGKLDDIVPARYTVNMVTGVQQGGGNAKVTIYPNANHNSWDPAFSEPKFLSWMFSHSRK